MGTGVTIGAPEVEDARIEAREAGLETLCTRDGCEGEIRGGRVAYGWDPDPSVRNARIRRGLRAAKKQGLVPR